jgi:hypothetical protein
LDRSSVRVPNRWTRPVSPSASAANTATCDRMFPKRNSPVPSEVHHATPPTVLSLSARFSFQRPSEWRAKRPASAASTGWRSVHSGTLQGATGGTQTHSRRTGLRLGRLQRARQGLVRVPESNTKYGGKVGRTGGPWAPLPGPSISESSEIPKRKKSSKIGHAQLRPLFTGGCWLRPGAMPQHDSTPRTVKSGQPCRPADGVMRRSAARCQSFPFYLALSHVL